MTDNGKKTMPPIQQQNNQGQGSTVRGAELYSKKPTDGWNGKKSGSTSTDTKPYG